jgi:serine protease AprX
MLRRIISWLLLASLLLVVPPRVAAAQLHAEIDPRVWDDLAAAPSVNLLVRLADPAGSTPALIPNSVSSLATALAVEQRIARTTVSQSDLRATLDAAGLPYRSYWIVNLIALKADRAEVERLAARPDVLTIEPDRAFQVPLETPAAVTPQPASIASIESGLIQVHAPDLWNLGFKGQGMVVASADTGVQWDHPALKPHYRGWVNSQANHNYNWWDAIHTPIASGTNPCGYNQAVPCDDFGHGTHTTGTMVGDDGLTNHIGMAPEAKWIACRNMDHGVGRPSTYIECLQWFIAPTDLAGNNPDPSQRPDAIDNSYGCPPSENCTTTSLHDAVEQVRSAGIFMSVSAGNSGPACSTINDPPGLETGVFTVGSVNSTGASSTFSSRGPVTWRGWTDIKPDLAAPGEGVRSSYPKNTYIGLMGTSMAAPHVAGGVALLWSAIPTLRRNIFLTEALLRESAVPAPVLSQSCGSTPAGSVPNNTTGSGVLNVLAAYNQWQQRPLVEYKSYIPYSAFP